MIQLRLIFLIFVLAATPGFRLRCFAFCSDQTSVQNDYVEQRDRCRDYAQLKLSMSPRNSDITTDDGARKAKLVTLFSECMEKNGWVVGHVDSKTPENAAAAKTATVGPTAAAAAASAAEAAESAARSKAGLSRTSECAFARHAAANSKIAAARARACDLECAGHRQAAPDAPLPAACEPYASPNLSTGTERDQ